MSPKQYDFILSVITGEAQYTPANKDKARLILIEHPYTLYPWDRPKPGHMTQNQRNTLLWFIRFCEVAEEVREAETII